jgi:hypothetical protein
MSMSCMYIRHKGVNIVLERQTIIRDFNAT